MATIRSESNNENNMHSTMPKQPLRMHSVKKQAFGELKNVIHNQPGGATPFRSHFGKANIAKPKNVTKTPFSEVKKPQQMVYKIAEKPVADDVDLLDYWDVPSKCCTEMCSKSDAEIWSEMNMINDTIMKRMKEGLNKKAHYSCYEDDYENFDDFVDIDVDMKYSNAGMDLDIDSGTDLDLFDSKCPKFDDLMDFFGNTF